MNRRKVGCWGPLLQWLVGLVLVGAGWAAQAQIVSASPLVFSLDVARGGVVTVAVLGGAAEPVRRVLDGYVCAELAAGRTLGVNASDPCDSSTRVGSGPGYLPTDPIDSRRFYSAYFSPESLELALRASATAGRATGSRRLFFVTVFASARPSLVAVRIDLIEPAPIDITFAPSTFGFTGTTSTLIGITSATSTLIDVAMAGPTPLAIRYTQASNDTPLGGQYCSALAIGYPATGVASSNPCAPGSSLGSAGPALGFGAGAQTGEQLVVPESIARQATQRARGSSGSGIFYFVRRFASGKYAVIRLRLIGDSPSAALVFTDVRLAFNQNAGSQSIGFFKRGQAMPPLSATLRYRGAGLIRARWEVVLPGDEPPSALDLTSEASLSPQQRAQQRRYRVLDRIQVLLPARGGGVLRGPDPQLLPNDQYGQYLLLLRIETADSVSGAPSGAAPFVLPVLRYYIGESGGLPAPEPLVLLSALMQADGQPPVFEWRQIDHAALYLVEIEALGQLVFSAHVLPDLQAPTGHYAALPFMAESWSAPGGRWRVLAFASDGQLQAQSPWREIPKPHRR